MKREKEQPFRIPDSAFPSGFTFSANILPSFFVVVVVAVAVHTAVVISVVVVFGRTVAVDCVSWTDDGIGGAE